MDASNITKSHWILPESLDFKQLQSQLSQRHPIRHEQAQVSSFTLYDTFDWRLFKKSRTLILIDQNLRLNNLDFSESFAETEWKNTDPPKFWWDVPAGALRKQLRTGLDVRALMPLLAVSRQTRVLRILNQDLKTVVFLLFSAYKTRPPSGNLKTTYLLELQPVKGYQTEYNMFRKFISTLGIKAGKGSLFMVLLKDQGLKPGGYSSKFSLGLAPELSSEEALYRIVSHLFSIMSLNEWGIRQDIDTEFLHDYRVAIRRIRSALGQFKGVIPEQQRLQMSTSFSKLGKATNKLRDLDVYLLKKPAYSAMLPDSLASGLDPLFHDLEQEREQELRAVVRWLKSREYAKTIQTCGSILDRQIKSQIDETPNALRPSLELASELIFKRYQRILKAGSKITALSPDSDLHRLRINCKKLRYLLEFFASLYPTSEISQLINQLKKLQDNLGDFNDLYVQQQHLQTYLKRVNTRGNTAPETAGAIGGLIAGLYTRQKKVRQKFKQRFQIFSSPQNQNMFHKLFKGTPNTGDSQ